MVHNGGRRTPHPEAHLRDRPPSSYPPDEATTSTVEMGDVRAAAPTVHLGVDSKETATTEPTMGSIDARAAADPIRRVVVQERQEHGLLVMFETEAGERRQVGVPRTVLAAARMVQEQAQKLIAPVDKGPTLGAEAIELLSILLRGGPMLELTEDVEDLSFEQEPITELIGAFPQAHAERVREEQTTWQGQPQETGRLVASSPQERPESQLRVPRRRRRRPATEQTTGTFRGLGMVEVVVLLGLGASMGLVLLIMVLAMLNTVVEERRASGTVPPASAESPAQVE